MRLQSTTELEQHPARQVLADLLTALQHERFDELVTNADPAVLFAREKLVAMTQLVNARISSTPAALCSLYALGQIHVHLSNVLVEVNNFNSNANVAHLLNAIAHMESNALSWLWGFPVSQPDASTGWAESAKDFSDFSQRAVTELKMSRDDLAAALEAAKREAARLAERLKAIEDSASTERAMAAAEIRNLQAEYLTREAERKEAFDKSMSAFALQLHESLGQADLTATEKLVQIEDLRGEAARVVQVIGNIGVTGNYQRTAQDESKAANLWRWITIVFFVVGVTVALVTLGIFLYQGPSAENIQSSIVRLLFALAITAPAFYTARESARHRTNADRARQDELELASLGPFIELLPEEKKIAIRETLTTRYFGRGVDQHDVKPLLTLAEVKDLIKELGAALRK